MKTRLLWLAALVAALTMASCHNSQPENTQPADTVDGVILGRIGDAVCYSKNDTTRGELIYTVDWKNLATGEQKNLYNNDALNVYEFKQVGDYIFLNACFHLIRVDIKTGDKVTLHASGQMMNLNGDSVEVLIGEYPDCYYKDIALKDLLAVDSLTFESMISKYL